MRILIFGSAVSRRLVVWPAAALTSAVWLRPFFAPAFVHRAPIGDRGVFIAAGKLIAEGAVPYRDIYDHKQPMIHLLGALAWTVSPYVEAVMRMEQAALVVLAAALFAMLRYTFAYRPLPALAGLSIGLITLRNPAVFEGGHLTEEYGIVFVMAALAFAALAARSGASQSPAARSYAAAAGCSAALALLTREACIAPIAVIGLCLHATRGSESRTLRRLVRWELAGFAIPVVLWGAFLCWSGAFGAYREVFRDNWAYSESIGDGRIFCKALVTGVVTMIDTVFGGRHLLALAAALLPPAAIAAAMIGRLSFPVPPAALALWFAAELMAASASGRFFGHYYIALVPLWAATFALAVELLLSGTARGTLANAARTLLCAVLMLSMGWGLDRGFQRLAATGFPWGLPASPALDVDTATRLRREIADDGLRTYVPLTGNDTSLWLEMPLPLATRFFYQFPWLFRPADVRRRTELTAALNATDVVVVNVGRPRLSADIDNDIAGVLARDFRLAFASPQFQFFVRRGPDRRRSDRGAR